MSFGMSDKIKSAINRSPDTIDSSVQQKEPELNNDFDQRFYKQRIDRAHPTCILFLIDQSYSMIDPIAGSDMKKKSVAATDAINKCLRELTLKCPRDSGQVKNYFYIGAIGYGISIDSAFTGQFSGKDLVPISELADNPSNIEERIKKEEDGVGGIIEKKIRFPIWFEPIANGSTPMCAAFNKAYIILEQWLSDPSHKDCYPPIIINITDGESTDGDPTSNAERLKKLSTNDGNVLLFNIHISASQSYYPILYPGEETKLPDENAQLLFRISSQLTDKMKDEIKTTGIQIQNNSRAFVYNADITAMIKALETGTGTARSMR